MGMNAANISLLHALVLIGVGGWGYFESGSFTALIPVGFGVVIAALNPGVRKKNPVIAHIAVLLTLVVLIALVMPLRSAVNDGRSAAILRVILMVAASAVAMVAFVQSFIAARRAKETSTSTDP